MIADMPELADDFSRTDAQLADDWDALHTGDQEPFPDGDFVASLREQNPQAELSDDDQTLAQGVLDAWHKHHAGEFAAAIEAGKGSGSLGLICAVKSAAVAANYLVDAEAEKKTLLRSALALAETAMQALPDHANVHYCHAFALGRLSQLESIAKALAQGHGGKVKASLERAIELQPDHADAHLALGLYHAEVVDKVGSMIARMTYGAKNTLAEEHFERALALNGQAPITHIEYANGLLLMHGDKRMNEAVEAYERAAELPVIDAMTWLDRAFARAELEDE